MSQKNHAGASRARVPWQVRAESVEPRRKALGHRLKKKGEAETWAAGVARDCEAPRAAEAGAGGDPPFTQTRKGLGGGGEPKGP